MELTCKGILHFYDLQLLSLAKKQLRCVKSTKYFFVYEQLIGLPFCTYIITTFFFLPKAVAKVNYNILATGKFLSNFITFKSLTF